MGLGERQNRILSAVVNQYVKTAEPVGSELLAERYAFGVRPATIRNELAAMSEMGYLRQPHTSAGRVPSDLGYRYYVDELMPRPRLGSVETHRARQSYDPYEGEIEHILQQTCRILAGLCKYISLATPPQMETVSIKHIALSAVGPGKILVVTVLNSGHIDHRLADSPVEVGPIDLVRIANLLNERLSGLDMQALSTMPFDELPADLAVLSAVYSKVLGAVKQALASTEDDEVYVDGASHILRQPEFTHSDKATVVLETLQQRKRLYQILSRVLLGSDVTVIIGRENQVAELSECSFVATQYSIGGRVCGSIGVVGPTRMDYRRAVAAVRFMASNLSDLLTQMSIG